MAIATRLVNEASVFRPDAPRWDWQLVLIDLPNLSATCTAGGRITIFTGLIARLHLGDDEIAAIMAHEIAHAMREHSRERLSWSIAEAVLNGAAVATSHNLSVQGGRALA